MSSVQRAPEFFQADLQIMPDVAYPLMSGHQRNLGLRFRRAEQRVAVLRGRVFFKIWFMEY
ncbi:MAG TPA: hypothetical protein DCL09_05085 [Sutterella sp.]|nr:hypothetical protein [Sutterella sp.]